MNRLSTGLQHTLVDFSQRLDMDIPKKPTGKGASGTVQV